MIPKLNRGQSFKGLTAYLMHDKREEGAADDAPHPETAERVGFTRTMNFHGAAAEDDPALAAKLMALTWKAREALKRAAGIKPGGSEAEAPPVWHSSLSWEPSERPDGAEMMRAVESYLKHQGLGLEKGYQTYVVEHTDTAHPHVHIVVNLVHPETGKQANPYRDRQKAQSWARDYERQRGAIFCHDREAKYAEIDRARSSHATTTRAAFNDNAQGGSAGGPAPGAAAQPDRFGRSRKRKPRQRRQQQRPEWQARKAAGNDNRTARAAAERIKAEAAAQWAALKAAERAAFTQRSAEAARLSANRKAGREAIFEKYRSALDAVWTPQGGPKTASPDRSSLWRSVRERQAARQRAFEKNERSALGRVRNALTLAGKGASLLRTVRLAVDATERRRVFERGQRAIAARTIPKETRLPTRPQPKTPEPKRVQAERLKAMRAKELAEHSRETTARGAAMKARHTFQTTAEKAARAMLSRDITAAWQQHEAAYGPPRTAEARKERKLEPAPPASAGAGLKAGDRFGRRRDRQRPPRREATTGQEIEVAAGIGGQRDEGAENSAVEAGYLPGQFSPAANEQASPAPPEAAGQPQAGQEHEPAPAEAGDAPKTSWTAEERDAAIAAARERREAGERAAGEHENDPGREMTR
jgi:MobA/VirD2-like, nuclease domain